MKCTNIYLDDFVLEPLDISKDTHISLIHEMGTDAVITENMYHFDDIFGSIEQLLLSPEMLDGCYAVCLFDDVIGYLDIEDFGLSQKTKISSTYFNLSFLQEHRNKGYGKRLLKSLLDYLDELGYQSVIACVKPWNEYSKLLVESCGFVSKGNCDYVKTFIR